MHISHKTRQKSITQAFTRGRQIFFHNWRMYFQTLQRIVHWSIRSNSGVIERNTTACNSSASTRRAISDIPL